MAVTDVIFSGLVTTGSSSSDSVATPIVDSLGRTGVFDFSIYKELSVFVQLKSITGGAGGVTVQVIVANYDGQASPYVANLNGDAPAWTGANQYRTSIGPGTSHNDSLSSKGRLVWNIAVGTLTSAQFYVHIEGKR